MANPVVTPTINRKSVWGDRRVNDVTLAFDTGTYVAGGIPITAAMVGLNVIDFVLFKGAALEVAATPTATCAALGHEHELHPALQLHDRCPVVPGGARRLGTGRRRHGRRHCGRLLMAQTPQSQTLLVSAARTATTTVADQVNLGHNGLHLVISLTVLAAAETVTPKIQGKDSLGNYYDILVGSAISSTGITVLKVYPGIAAVANGSASDVLPPVWRVVLTHSSTGAHTYSVALNLAP
jgi:hypothetical protein